MRDTRYHIQKQWVPGETLDIISRNNEGTGPTWWATLPAGQPAHGRHTAHGPALPARQWTDSMGTRWPITSSPTGKPLGGDTLRIIIIWRDTRYHIQRQWVSGETPDIISRDNEYLETPDIISRDNEYLERHQISYPETMSIWRDTRYHIQRQWVSGETPDIISRDNEYLERHQISYPDTMSVRRDTRYHIQIQWVSGDTRYHIQRQWVSGDTRYHIQRQWVSGETVIWRQWVSTETHRNLDRHQSIHRASHVSEETSTETHSFLKRHQLFVTDSLVSAERCRSWWQVVRHLDGSDLSCHRSSNHCWCHPLFYHQDMTCPLRHPPRWSTRH